MCVRYYFALLAFFYFSDLGMSDSETDFVMKQRFVGLRCDSCRLQHKLFVVRSELVMTLVLLIRNFVSFSNVCNIKTIETKKPFYRRITSLFYAFIKHTVYLFITIGSLLTFCCIE